MLLSLDLTYLPVAYLFIFKKKIDSLLLTNSWKVVNKYLNQQAVLAGT